MLTWQNIPDLPAGHVQVNPSIVPSFVQIPPLAVHKAPYVAHALVS